MALIDPSLPNALEDGPPPAGRSLPAGRRVWSGAAVTAPQTRARPEDSTRTAVANRRRPDWYDGFRKVSTLCVVASLTSRLDRLSAALPGSAGGALDPTRSLFPHCPLTAPRVNPFGRARLALVAGVVHPADHGVLAAVEEVVPQVHGAAQRTLPRCISLGKAGSSSTAEAVISICTSTLSRSATRADGLCRRSRVPRRWGSETGSSTTSPPSGTVSADGRLPQARPRR